MTIGAASVTDGSALHNKQQNHNCTAYTGRKRKSTAAVLRHGEKRSTSTAQSDWLAAVRTVVAPPPHGACVCLPWTERMMRRKRDAVRSSSISVNCDTSHAIPSDYLQPRPSPSAAVGAFSLHRAPSRASSLTNTTGEQQPRATASTEYKRRIHLHCNVCVLRVWLCVPTVTRKGKKTEKRNKVSEETHKHKCTAEAHAQKKKNGRAAQTQDCTAARPAANHRRFIQNKRKPSLATPSYINPVIKKKKTSSVTVPHKFKNQRKKVIIIVINSPGCRVATPNCLHLFCPQNKI
ncbi:hypothetical protein Tc00.1047053508703.25 [Trypanosoma cruzi]|uniref:Uncharacterized protein n=1 Tax=Trypanosoma cruzi (strain CL Brener) TaxID=353153 RepID=Q4CNW5_TRYCC|nr:hypothetical protein Tc00.1047053508703.25 [Trypanosoma cruzi]EAN81967.1 hypothetical protein Tc00.1047053508703.25 [Trypanosoma cruzi]|eukprot:XP_803494.1 hypothetical protein [Trypanosoma cruzi strain CL Brener]